MFTHFEKSKSKIILSDEAIRKREALQNKWREMEDSYEKRDVSALLFADSSMLGIVDLAILNDNIEVYLDNGWKQGKFWRQHLDLASLLGSKNIGEFILDSKKDLVTKDDYERILGYISLSFNKEWTIGFAKKMEKNGMRIPDSIYAFCDDYDLLQDVKEAFLLQPAKPRY